MVEDLTYRKVLHQHVLVIARLSNTATTIRASCCAVMLLAVTHAKGDNSELWVILGFHFRFLTAQIITQIDVMYEFFLCAVSGS